MANLFASLPSARSRCVCHIDLDCFYVAVERKRRPSLEGRACAVVQYNNNNAARQRGESAFGGGAIIALSYEAKALGVRRHMRGEEARRVCPSIELVTVPVKNEKADLTHYREAGTEVFSRLSSSAARLHHSELSALPGCVQYHSRIALAAAVVLSRVHVGFSAFPGSLQ